MSVCHVTEAVTNNDCYSLDVIRRLNFERPTPIQSQAIPAIMSGRDVIGIAKTGSGKTIAFLLPLFRHLKDQRPLESMEGPMALVMTPTRELAVQIHRECKPFLKVLGLRVRDFASVTRFCTVLTPVVLLCRLSARTVVRPSRTRSPR